MKQAGNFLYARNALRRAQWAIRWSRQGGSMFWAARPLVDLRNEEDLRRYRLIEHKRRQLKRARKSKVINLAHERFERIRRKARSFV